MQQLERDIERLKQIEDVIFEVETKLQKISYDDYVNDRFIKFGFERMVEIVGEACRHISKEFQGRYPEIRWTEIIGMRHKLSHDYFRIDYRALWETVTEDIPILKKQIARLLDENNA
jgi:uncharacterized protein with HEPN domain